MDIKIGKNLKYIRKKTKKTQKELAELLGIRQTTLSMYECCLNNPSLEVFYKICIILNCSANELLGLE